MLEETTNGATKIYTYGNDLVKATNESANESWYAYDGLGSTRALTNANGTLTDEYTYEGFGNPVKKTGNSPNDFLFTGEQFEPNLELYYLRARYYDSFNDRFTIIDPLKQSNQFQQLHNYLYCNSDPINNLDPTGLYTLGEVLTVISIISTLSGTLSGIRAAILGESIFPAVAAGIVYGAIGAVLALAAPEVAIALGVTGTVGGVIGGATEIASGNVKRGAVDIGFIAVGFLAGKGIFAGLNKLAILPSKLPRGFEGRLQFKQCLIELEEAMSQSGISGKVYVRGSSVTGISSKTGNPFGPNTDIDFAITVESSTTKLNYSRNGLMYPNKVLNDFPAISEWAMKWSGILGRWKGPNPGVTPALWPEDTVFSDPTITWR